MTRPTRYLVCLEDGCPELVEAGRGRCPAHARERDRERKDASPWRAVYADSRWAALRRLVREQQDTCAVEGCEKTWRELNHIVPLREGGDPFARENVEGMCKPHHSAVTAREVRGSVEAVDVRRGRRVPTAESAWESRGAWVAPVRARALTLLGEGRSVEDVAAELDVMATTVARWARTA